MTSYTDLPCPLSGHGGNIHVDVADAFGELARIVEMLHEAAPGLPIDTSWRAVETWVADATERLSLVYGGTQLITKVRHLLEDVRSIHSRLDREAGLLRRRQEDDLARAAGTYWAQREGGRRCQKGTRIDVDPEAWAKAKARAHRKNLCVGEYVGQLIVADMARPAGPTSASATARRRHRSGAGRERIYARLTVRNVAWDEFAARSREAHLTVARHVGLLVEGAVARDRS